MDNNAKQVSVLVITYNHGRYIAQAIESIVTQQTDFGFELVIGEDFSTDNTRQICEQYASRYPNIIKLLPSDKNYGPMGNYLRTLKECSGKYIALLEGDDYWCDPQKLQRQFDFLSNNPDFTICFTAVDIVDEMNLNRNDEHFFPAPVKDVFTIEDFILSEMNIIPTPTIMFRNVLPEPLPDFYVNTMVGDMGLELFEADKGKAKLLEGKTAVYRNHSAGLSKTAENLARSEDALMKLYHQFNKYTGYRYNKTFRKRFLENAKVKLIYRAAGKNGIDRLMHYFKNIPAYFKYSDKLNMKEIIYYHTVLFFPFLLRKKK